ncbi:MAG: PKD domain-containing protein [Deltaproteobacteria bacterium]|nr:PKD domain-containing protein [Deltaproteobacteria bacterium]
MSWRRRDGEPSSLFLLLVACGDPVPEGGALFADGGDDRLAFVGEPLTLTAQESPGAVVYRWTSDGETAEGAEVDVTFSTPGRRQVYLEVLDADGRAEVDVLTVSVVRRPLATPPRVSASLTPSEDAQSLYRRDARSGPPRHR